MKKNVLTDPETAYQQGWEDAIAWYEEQSSTNMCPPHRWNTFGWCDDCSTIRIPEPVGSAETQSGEPT